MNVLKSLRKEKKITQDQVAQAIGITRNAYNMYERDVNKPSIETLIKLSSFYGVSMEYILGTSKYRTMFEEFSDRYNDKHLRAEIAVFEAVKELYGKDAQSILINISRITPDGISKINNYSEDILYKYSKDGDKDE